MILISPKLHQKLLLLRLLLLLLLHVHLSQGGPPAAAAAAGDVPWKQQQQLQDPHCQHRCCLVCDPASVACRQHPQLQQTCRNTTTGTGCDTSSNTIAGHLYHGLCHHNNRGARSCDEPWTGQQTASCELLLSLLELCCLVSDLRPADMQL